MRTLITTLMASAVTLMTFSAVQAADAIDEVPAAPAADYTEPAVKSWSGAYVGGTADWAHGKFDRNGGKTAAGFGGGLYGGYNMQNGQMVFMLSPTLILPMAVPMNSTEPTGGVTRPRPPVSTSTRPKWIGSMP